MSSILLCITNKCTRNCDFCFEGSFKQGPEQAMSVSDVHRICSFANLSHMRMGLVSVLGGEPTLHPQLLEILQLIRRMNPKIDVQILTNLLCDPDLLPRLAPFSLGSLVNIGGFPGYSTKEQELLHANLALLGRRRVFVGICVAVTITDENQDFDFLYDILKRDTAGVIGGLRVAFSAPGTAFANKFPKEFSFGYGDKFLEVVEECHKIKPVFGFSNECFVNHCMMSEEVHNKLSRVVRGLNTYCSGNLDLLPDFSTHWCFAFQEVPEMRIKNIFDYRNMDEVYSAIFAKAAALERDLQRQCDTTDCTRIGCRGPCLAMKYYLKYVRGKSRP